MNRDSHHSNIQFNVHYHIRWPLGNKLDWERFDSQQNVEARANELVLKGETYTIEKSDQPCARCMQMARYAGQ